MELISILTLILSLYFPTLLRMHDSYPDLPKRQLKLAQVLFIPWGNEADQLPAHWQVAYPTGLSVEDAPAMVAAPHILRLGAEGNMHIFQPLTGICKRYDQAQNYLGQTDLGKYVLDFQFIKGGYAVLSANDQATLRYVNLQGNALWSKPIDLEAGTRPLAVFERPSEIFVTSMGKNAQLLRYNLLDGTLLDRFATPQASDRWWRLGPDTIGTLGYDATSRRRGVTHYALATGIQKDYWLDDQYFGLLATVFASDGQDGLLMHPTPDFGRGYEWLHIHQNGEVLTAVPFWQILASTTGTSYLLSRKENELRIQQFPGNTQQQIQLPELPAGHSWQVYGLSAQDEPVLEIRDRIGRLTKQMIVAKDGSLVAPEVQLKDPITALQGTETWMATSEGIVLPLRTAKGLHLIRVLEE